MTKPKAAGVKKEGQAEADAVKHAYIKEAKEKAKQERKKAGAAGAPKVAAGAKHAGKGR